MRLYNDQVRELIGFRPLGREYTITCPACKHRNASATLDDDGLRWVCFRASCRAAGVEDGALGALVARKAPPVDDGFVSNPYLDLHETDYIDGEGYLLNRFTGAQVWPCWSMSGQLLGHQVRGREPDGTKRVRTFKIEPGPLYAYYPSSRFPERTWIVEDNASAFRLYRGDGARSIALLGVSVPDALAWSLRATGGVVWVALDPGAETASLKARDKLRAVGVNANVLFPDKDVKDMSDTEFQTFIAQVQTV